MEQPRVLIVHPPMSIARDFIDYPFFCDLGAVQLAAVLRGRGCDVGLINSFALPSSGLTWRPDGRAHLGAPPVEVLATIGEHLARSGAPDLVVVTYAPFHCPPSRDDVLSALLVEVRTLLPTAPIVLADAYQSGQHYVDAPGSHVMAAYPECDAYVQYEAEETVGALVDALPARPSGVHRGAEPRSLDALPPPAWDLIDLGAHDRFRTRVVERMGRGAWAFPIDGRTLPVVTSRGCPFTCTHCSSNPGRAEGAPKTQRRYSEAALRARLEALVRVHGATRLEVLDELVNVNERHWESFLDAVDALDTRFDVPNGMRADYLSAEHLRRMRGRVTTVSVSAESGVQRVVTEVVKKRLDLREIVRVARDARDARVPLMVHYIIGMPGESAAEINATLAFALDLHARFEAWPAVQYATPLPGTDLARGRSLPVVDDWGPRFQAEPSQPGMSVTPAALRAFRGSFERRMEAASERPTAVLYATHLCNNCCAFCATGPRTGQREHPAGLFAQLERLRREGAVALTLDGGEPTLRRDLSALIRHARALGFERVDLHTNGRMCSYAHYAHSLVSAGLTSVRVGLHGASAATHDRVVGEEGAFSQTVAGLRQLARHIPAGLVVGTSFTPIRDNLMELDGAIAFAHSLGLSRFDVRVLAPMGVSTPDIAPDQEALGGVLREVLTRWSDRLTVRVHGLPFCLLPGYEGALVGDAARVVSIIQQGVDLPGYLASQRVRRPECEGCAHRLVCDGFYELASPTMPTWMVGVKGLT